MCLNIKICKGFISNYMNMHSAKRTTCELQVNKHFNLLSENPKENVSKDENVSSPSTCKTQYCGEPP